MAIDLRSLKPNVVTTDLAGKSFLLYGGVKTGKTTAACKFPKPLLLAFEKGYNMIPGVMAQPINNWSEALQAKRQLIDLMREYERGKVDEPMFKTVIIDTADIAWDQVSDYVCQSMGINYMDESEFNSAYSRAKKHYSEFFQDIFRAGYAVVAISHVVEKVKKSLITGEKHAYVLPSLSNKALEVITGFVDLVACAENIEQEDGTTKLMLRMRGNDVVEAGSRNPYTSELIPFTYEALAADMAQAMQKLGETAGQEIVATPINPHAEQSTDSYAEVMGEVKKYAQEFRTAGFAEKYQGVIEKHLGKDKRAKDCTEAQVDVLRVIRDELAASMNELGLVPKAS